MRVSYQRVFAAVGAGGGAGCGAGFGSCAAFIICMSNTNYAMLPAVEADSVPMVDADDSAKLTGLYAEISLSMADVATALVL